MAMHVPHILESFHIVSWKVSKSSTGFENFPKAPLVLESFHKLHWFWKVFKSSTGFGKFSKAPLSHDLTLVLFSC
jgi:hypothetical protein